MTGFDNTEVAEDMDTEFKAIPKGDYSLQLSDGGLDKSKTPARASFTFEILKGDFKGRKVFSNYQVDETGGPFLRRDMKYLGCEIADSLSENTLFVEIAKISQKMPLIEAYLKPRIYNEKTYYNVYLKNPAAKKAEDKVTSEAGFDTKDEIPF